MTEETRAALTFLAWLVSLALAFGSGWVWRNGRLAESRGDRVRSAAFPGLDPVGPNFHGGPTMGTGRTFGDAMREGQRLHEFGDTHAHVRERTIRDPESIPVRGSNWDPAPTTECSKREAAMAAHRAAQLRSPLVIRVPRSAIDDIVIENPESLGGKGVLLIPDSLKFDRDPRLEYPLPDEVGQT